MSEEKGSPHMEVEIGGKGTRAVLDTGATRCCFPWSTYRIWEGDKPALEPADITLRAANNDKLGLKGKFNTVMRMGIYRVPVTFYVIEGLQVPLIGVDILQRFTMDMEAQTLQRKNGAPVSFTYGCDRYSVGRVHLTKTEMIPKQCQMVKWLPIANDKKGTNKVKDGTIVLVEPNADWKCHGVVMGKVLARVENGMVPVRFCNYGKVDRYLIGSVAHISTEVEQYMQLPTGTALSVQSSSELKDEKEERRCEEADEKLKKEIQKKVDESNGNEKEKSTLFDILWEKRAAFGTRSFPKPSIHCLEPIINTQDAQPITEYPRWINVNIQKLMDTEMDRLVTAKHIQRSDSAWSSAVVMVRKSDLTIRFCIDYRNLNYVTVRLQYPLPTLEESQQKIAGATWISTLDYQSGYHQLAMHPDDIPKTAFSVRGKHAGQWEWRQLPFGLVNAPLAFQRTLERLMPVSEHPYLSIYIDDLVIFSTSHTSHIEHISQILSIIIDNGFTLKLSKCTFGKEEVEYLRILSLRERNTNQSQRIESIINYPTPTDTKTIKRFVHTTNWYRKFIKDYAMIADPLFKVSNKNKEFYWEEAQVIAFDTIKHKLVTAPVLAHPCYNKPFVINTDASTRGLGAVLQQEERDQLHPIAYGSQALSKEQVNWHINQLETYCVVWALRKWRVYVLGGKVLVLTDNSQVAPMLKSKNSIGKVARWGMIVQEYDIEIRHVAAAQNVLADALCRIPELESDLETVLVITRHSRQGLMRDAQEQQQEERDEEDERRQIVDMERWSQQVPLSVLQQQMDRMISGEMDTRVSNDGGNYEIVEEGEVVDEDKNDDEDNDNDSDAETDTTTTLEQQMQTDVAREQGFDNQLYVLRMFLLDRLFQLTRQEKEWAAAMIRAYQIDLNDDMELIKTTYDKRTDETIEKAIIPSHMSRQMMKETHDDDGHMGVANTIDKMDGYWI